VPHIGRHTIIGNSAAALAAIRAIRHSGDQRPIALISAESDYAYSPVLTTYYIGGQISRSHMYLTNEHFYRRYDVQTMMGHRVEAVDTDRQRLYLQGRKPQHYEQLLIASGASARKLKKVEPAARGYVHTLRTVEDAERIRHASSHARAVVLIGAGLVSLQTIKAILPMRTKIWLLVGSGQVLSQQMDRRSALLIQERLTDAGVEILFGRGIEGIYRKEQRVRVVTTWGESLVADLVVVGKGVRPNRQMVAHTPIRCDYGIVVDDRMRTSVDGVYAAGDVAQGENSITGKSEVIATWFNACTQGEIAGRNMAGTEARGTQQIRENVTTLMELVVVTLGESNPPQGRYEEICFENPRSGK
jgi:NAD(P)H-nitrite reductase large subunit